MQAPKEPIVLGADPEAGEPDCNPLPTIDEESLAAATAALDAVGGANHGGDESNQGRAEAAGAAHPTEMCAASDRRALLEACIRAMLLYKGSSRTEPLLLPSSILPADRAVLHDVAQQHELVHETIKEAEGASSRLKISKVAQPLSEAEEALIEETFRNDIPPIDQSWADGHEKYDPRHWFGILLTIAVSKASPLFAVFAVACAMCVYKPMTGEYKRVVDHKQALFRKKHGRKMTALEVAKIPFKYLRSMMRQMCPPPLTIMLELHTLCEIFSSMICPVTNRMFFIPSWRSLLWKQLKYVAGGLLSDCPSLSLYFPTRKLSTGFQMYRCLRTSSALEGYHKHLRMLVEAAYAAKSNWLDLIMNAFDFRWSVKAGREAGLYDGTVAHFEMQMLDALQNAYGALPFKTRQMEGHRAVVDRASTVRSWLEPTGL